MHDFLGIALDSNGGEDMGYVVNAEKEQETFLWRCVILQAVRDALSGSKRTRERLDRLDAERWFYEGGEDFQLVCQYAGLPAAMVQNGVLDFLTNPNADHQIFKLNKG